MRFPCFYGLRSFILYADMIRIGKYAVGKIDWDKDFTYGHRIELERIFTSEERDYWKMSEAFSLFYGFSRKVLPMGMRLQVFESIAEGFRGWIEKERTLLDYQPSEEELRAGIRDLSAKVGNMTTVKALAKTYGTDPDTILQWPYSKVFILLYTDLEERKFEKKLSKEYERNRNKH